jgi:hypothetical protein
VVWSFLCRLSVISVVEGDIETLELRGSMTVCDRSLLQSEVTSFQRMSLRSLFLLY